MKNYAKAFFFTPLCFNALCQSVPHLILCPLIFCLPLFGRFISIFLKSFFLWDYFLFAPLGFMPASAGTGTWGSIVVKALHN